MNQQNEHKPTSIVDSIFDIGLAWTEVGLLQGKTALENVSRALSKTAKHLDAIREALQTDEQKAA